MRRGASCGTAGTWRCTGGGCSSSTATRWSARLLRSALDLGVAVRTEAPAEALVVEGGRVVGARLGGAARGGAGATRWCSPRAGFRTTRRGSRRCSASGRGHHSAAPAGNTGDGLRMGEAVGGVVADDLVHRGRLGAGVAGAAAGRHRRALPAPRRAGEARLHRRRRARPALRQRGRQLPRLHGGADARDAGGRGPVAWLISDHAAQRRWGLGWAEALSVPARPVPARGLSQARPHAGELRPWPAGSIRRRSRRRWRGSTRARGRGEDPDFGRGALGLQPGAGRCGARGPNPALGPLETRTVLCGEDRARAASGPSRGCGPTRAARVLDRDGSADPRAVRGRQRHVEHHGRPLSRAAGSPSGRR